MNLPEGTYCRWTCTGQLISVEIFNAYWRPYRILAVESDPGPVFFYDRNITHFAMIDSLAPGQVVTLSGLITPENQSSGGHSPYFLNPMTIEAC